MMRDKIFDRICEQALEEAKEDEAYDIVSLEPIRIALVVRCKRCQKAWWPRVPEPKQCRWCHSRGWRVPRGEMRRGRPRLAEKKA